MLHVICTYLVQTQLVFLDLSSRQHVLAPAGQNLQGTVHACMPENTGLHRATPKAQHARTLSIFLHAAICMEEHHGSRASHTIEL